jgi:hypothetical protein
MSAFPQLLVEPRHNGERLLRILQQHFPEYHPIISVARIAHETEGDPQTKDIALRAHATVLKYVEPELKSIEVKDGLKDRRTITVSLFEDAEIITEPPRVEQQPGNNATDLAIIELSTVDA